MQEKPHDIFTLKADLVLSAIGFAGLRRPGMIEQCSVELDQCGNVRADTVDYRTSCPRYLSRAICGRPVFRCPGKRGNIHDNVANRANCGGTHL